MKTLIKEIVEFFSSSDLSGYPDIKPRGYVTTYPGERLSTEEKDKNFQRMFLSKKKRKSLRL